MELGKTLSVTNRADWGAWLERYHDKEPEIWLIYYNKASGNPAFPMMMQSKKLYALVGLILLSRKLGLIGMPSVFLHESRKVSGRK